MSGSIRDLVDGLTGDELGVTPDGARKLVQATARDIPAVNDLQREPRVQSRRQIADIVEYLELRGDTDRRELVDMFFQPASMDKRELGFYPGGAGREWFQEVATPVLERLECTAQTGEGPGGLEVWGFKGVNGSAGDLDDEHIRPLEELRADPKLQARAALDERGVPRRSDDRDAIMKLWSAVQAAGEKDRDELAGRVGGGSRLAELEGDLEALPGIKHTVDTPPSPDEIEIDTMADVIEAEELLERGPIEGWRFDDPTDGY